MQADEPKVYMLITESLKESSVEELNEKKILDKEETSLIKADDPKVSMLIGESFKESGFEELNYEKSLIINCELFYV